MIAFLCFAMNRYLYNIRIKKQTKNAQCEIGIFFKFKVAKRETKWRNSTKRAKNNPKNENIVKFRENVIVIVHKTERL